MAIEGTLDLFPLPDILQLISHQGKTGILTVQGDRDILAISFDRGRVVAADALNQTLEEALGEVLAGHGLVAPADFAAVSAQQRAGRGRLFDLLIEGGYIDRAQMLGALRLHVYRLLVELLGWRQGEFKFYGGDEVAQEEDFQPISVEELLIRSVEEAAGGGHPTIPDSRSFYQAAPVEGRVLRVRREHEPAASAGPGEIWLAEAEATLLAELGEGASVSELASATSFEEYKVRYILHRLLELGLARRRPVPVAQIVEEEGDFSVAVPEPAVPEMPPAAAPRVTGRPQARARAGTSLPVWGGRLLGGLAAVLAISVVLGRSWRVLAPFPWQGPAREALAEGLAAADFRRIEHAAKTHHLTHGGFPERLDALVASRLLTPVEGRDPFGEVWSWRVVEGSYEIAGAGASAAETVSENYLLDPGFSFRTQSDEAPLILLD